MIFWLQLTQSLRMSSDSLWDLEQRFSCFSRLQLPNVSIIVFEVSWFMIISVLLLPRPHQTVIKLEYDIQGNLNLCLSIFGCRDFFSLRKELFFVTTASIMITI